jgi:hypothetical protein
LLVKLMAGLLVNKPGLEKEITRVQSETAVYLNQLRAMDATCRTQPLETGYDRGLYLALRRGLLLVEAQTVWLEEVKHFLSTGARKKVTAPKL